MILVRHGQSTWNVPFGDWRIDAGIPDPVLTPTGREQASQAARRLAERGITRLVTSPYKRTIETAEIIAKAVGAEVQVRQGMHENDRSATGYLPAEAFERTADQFFARPFESVDGWERAIDAQKRIVDEMDSVLQADDTCDVLVIGHGGVGTLLLCHLAGLDIDRRHDQPAGGGHFFTVARPSLRLLHTWRRMEHRPSD